MLAFSADVVRVSVCFRELQRHRENIIEKLAALKQEQTNNEDERIAKAVAEREARQIREQQKKEAKHTAMLNSITAHREITVNLFIQMK